MYTLENVAICTTRTPHPTYTLASSKVFFHTSVGVTLQHDIATMTRLCLPFLV